MGTTYTGLIFTQQQLTGFILSQPKKTGSISQKRTHPSRKVTPAHQQVVTWTPHTVAEN